MSLSDIQRIVTKENPSIEDAAIVTRFSDGATIEELCAVLNTPGIRRIFVGILQKALAAKVFQKNLDEQLASIVARAMKQKAPLDDESKPDLDHPEPGASPSPSM